MHYKTGCRLTGPRYKTSQGQTYFGHNGQKKVPITIQPLTVPFDPHKLPDGGDHSHSSSLPDVDHSHVHDNALATTEPSTPGRKNWWTVYAPRASASAASSVSARILVL